MRAITVLLFLLAAGTVGAANSFIEIGDRARLPLPDGWNVSGSADDFPVRITHSEISAELLLYETVLTGEDVIPGPGAFQVAVDEVLDSVVLQLPDALLLSSTGYDKQGFGVFEIEFVTSDTVSTTEIRHRLVGKLYRHVEGFQLLYTLWGKASQGMYPSIRGDLARMQDGFRYVGAADELVFESSDGDTRWYLLLLFAILAVLFVMRRRRAVKETATGHVRTWQCPCGRINYIGNEECRSCGEPRGRR